MLKLQYFGSKILHKKCEEVPFGEDLTTISKQMFDITKKHDGCGLASPQVNLNKRMFILDLSFLKNKIINLPFKNEVVINPKIKASSEYNDLRKEGCLSIPDLYIKVLRPIWLEVEYWDINWGKKNIRLENIFSRIFSHEYDHLDGILITDRASKKEKKKFDNHLSKFL